MKVILFTIIESNEKNINNMNAENNFKKRLYEDEAIKCFKNWRHNAGWLKDIPIYCVCPSNNKPSEKTILDIKELDVIYEEKYFEETESYSCGFWNIPLVGKYFEEKFKDEDVILIKIDLDMYCIKEIPLELFLNDKPLCGQNTGKINGKFTFEQFDTGFVISKPNSNFYHEFYKRLFMLTESGGDDHWKNFCQNEPFHVLEEYAVDTLYNENSSFCIPIKNYQVGEGFHPNSIIEEEKVFFWHEHKIPNNIQKALLLRKKLAQFYKKVVSN